MTPGTRIGVYEVISILGAMEVDNLLVVLVDSAAEHLRVTHATCVLFDPKARDALRSHVMGFGRDPVLGLKDEAARKFFELLRNSDGPVPFQEEHNPDLLAALKQVDRPSGAELPKNLPQLG